MDTNIDQWTLIVASNDETVLNGTLLASPIIDSRCQLIVKTGFPSASKAYNAGLLEARNEVIVFAHQDVYLPSSWMSDLARSLSVLQARDPYWGVLGVFGIARDAGRAAKGFCYSTGLNRVLGQPFSGPDPASSLDELLLVIRRSSGLSFDSQLPGFHLYGTDLCLESESRNMSNYVIPAFCIHNSNGLKYYPLSYWEAYVCLQRKWWSRLPVKTCCATLTKSGVPMLAQIATDIRKRLFSRPKVGVRSNNVGLLYEKLCLTESCLKQEAGFSSHARHLHSERQTVESV